ncbi:RNase H domain-containing protein [Trichonephila clavipes]|nr:RNase H domain-containing protein [Trichonephila clavipes]
MKRAIMATYFHKASTDAYTQHGLCLTNEDTWSEYNRAITTGIFPGFCTAREMETVDRERLRKANYDILQNSKEARLKKRHNKCILEDTLAEERKISSYGAGTPSLPHISLGGNERTSLLPSLVLRSRLSTPFVGFTQANNHGERNNIKAVLEAIIKGDTNISSAINVLLESLHCKGISCLLQWIPAHVNIDGKEFAVSLAKEDINQDHHCPTITLADANVVANYRLLPHRYNKPLIVDFYCSRNLTSLIAKLRTGHFKGMKISSDKTRTYIPCKNCTDAQLTQDHILECPTLTPHIIRFGMVPLASELCEILYSADAPRRF